MNDRDYLQSTDLNLSDKVLNKRRFKKKILDLHTKEFMLGQAIKQIDPEKNTLDVGASVGLYASKFAEFSKWVHCFEAVPFVHDQRLQEVAKRYPNITTHNKAVADFTGVSEFWVDDKKLGNNSFSNIVNGQKIKVETVTLDSYEFKNVGFLKADTEGHELKVLKGATDLLESQTPVCMIEIYPVFNDGPISATFQFMWDTGLYDCYYNHRAQGLKPITSVNHGVEVANGDIEIHDGDFLFMPKNKNVK